MVVLFVLNHSSAVAESLSYRKVGTRQVCFTALIPMGNNYEMLEEVNYGT